MRFTKQLSSMALLLAITSGAKAGLLIEPYLGYEATKNTFSRTSFIVSPDAGGTLTGTSFGLRLGYKLPVMAWAALDYSMGTGKLKVDNSIDFADADAARTVLGVTAGIDLPIFLRAWVGVGLNDQLDLTTAGAKDSFKGTNTKVGVGLGFIPFVSVNVEYILRKYTDATLASGATYSSTYSKTEQSSVLVSVSAPFNF